MVAATGFGTRAGAHFAPSIGASFALVGDRVMMLAFPEMAFGHRYS